MRLLGLFFHRNNDPWSSAPPWAIEQREMVRQVLVRQDRIIELEKRLMAAIDDLKTSIAALITEGTSDISDLVAKINSQANQDPAIVALTQQVTDATASLHKAFTDATGVALPPPTPAP